MKMFMIGALIVLLASCFNKTYNSGVGVSGTNDIQFKSWLKDTLEEISLNKVNKFREISVSKDSLFLDIKSYYKMKLSQKFDGGNKDLIYAIDLLERTNNIPKNNFILELEIHHYFSSSMVPQLVYDFDSEISKFYVEYHDSTFAYRFIKGNLIEKRLILKANP